MAQGASSPIDELERQPPATWTHGLAFVLPTYVGRSSLGENVACVEALATQVASVRSVAPKTPLLVIVGMQWESGQEGTASERLQALSQVAQRTHVDFMGLSLPRTRKNATLNAALRLVTALGVCGVGWVDDDVRLAPDCLARLVERFLEKSARGAVGARKIPEPKAALRASRALLRVKEISKTPAYSYPHGCCMLIDAAVAAAGIPSRYLCEDDYICFALLDPSASNPLENLEVVQDALCFHTVGGPTREIYRRIRRSLFTGHILQADFPAEVSAFYMRRMQFNGLWPLGPLDASLGVRGCTVKWFVKALYFSWFLEVGFELALRGLVRRPLREIAWSPYSEYSVPLRVSSHEHRIGDLATSGET
jgi:hypothetical protein